MRVKKLILALAITTIIANISYSADFYPELGMDPLYSSLNPTYTQGDEVKERETLFDLIKRKFKKGDTTENQVSDEKQKAIKEAKKAEEEAKKAEKELNAKSSKVKEEKKFVRPKKNSDFVKELEKEEREKEKVVTDANPESLKNKLMFWKKPVIEEKNAETEKEPDLELVADHMEYFPDKYEVEAIGNAKVNFKKYGMILSADKISYDYDRAILKAKDNVVLVSNDTITEGEFIRLDLTKPNGFIENPVTVAEDIKLSAKEAYIYSDKIEQYDGVAKVMKNEVLKFGSTSFSNYVDKGNILSKSMRRNTPLESGVYSLKAKTIVIDAKDDHDVITIKNADLMLRNHRIAIIPTAKIVSNKDHTSVETNMPELGGISMLGSYIGPAVVLNVPGGSTLKLAPILTYSDDKFGIGGIARFRNEYNMTEVAYGTSRDNLLIRGKHKIAPGLTLTYSKYTNQNEWFLGYRRPKYSAQLNYGRTDYIKDLKLHFSQMYTAGAFVDYNERTKEDFGMRDAEGRFRWMTQTYKPIYSIENKEGSFGLNTGIVAQTAATLYTTGDVTGIFRVGPSISTYAGPWEQSVIYYQSAVAGQSPFEFDRYRYGHSNLVFIESLKVCKYLSIGYLASLAMNKDQPYDRTFQENRFLISVGPDYAKVTLGYDSRRRNTTIMLSMLVGTQNSDIEFKRSVINNIEPFGKSDSKQKKKEKKKNYKKLAKEIEKEAQKDQEL